MYLWIAMAVLAAAACLPPLMALTGARRGGTSEPAAAMAIYRDQLGELDRDLARGLVGKDEAVAARAEIARRLIRAGEAESAALGHSSRRTVQVAAAAVVAAPLAALALYVAIGFPGLPDQPRAARLSAPIEQQDISTLVARAEAHVAANPEDGVGWEVLAPVYLRMGRYDEAVSAYANALRILGATGKREADLGAAIVEAQGGIVTNEARAAFERAHAQAPDDPQPRFYLALALGQEGRTEEAIAAWRALIGDAPADAPWLAPARSQLARLEGTAAPQTARGPDAAQLEAAAEMSPENRQTMIEGMVASLAARLEAEPNDAEGWTRLVRSYMVLGRPADARQALVDARLALADDADKLALVEETARATGLAP